jgi:hypothetical protein
MATAVLYSDALRVFRYIRVLPFIIWLAACAEPPIKEMNQAQGAIDAARAAGADEYAPTEMAAAIDTLRRAEEAVAQKDYRLALSLAIDSRTQAQNAAKRAVDTRSSQRGDAERAVAEVSTLIAHANGRLKDPALARVPRRTLDRPRATIAAAAKTLQEAREALKAGNYARATALTQGLATRVQAALATIDTATAPQRSQRRP